MFRCIEEGCTAGGEILFNLNRDRSRLPGRQIPAPDVASLLEDDRVFPEARELDVKIREARQLLHFLGPEVDREEIHSPIAIGEKINVVIRSPHRANVLGRIVRQIFGRLSLEVEDPDIVRHAAAVMFPSAEFTKDAVERHF